MPFADELLGAGVAMRLADVLEGVRPGRRFEGVRDAAGRFEGLSLRQRTDLVAAALLDEVPGSFGELEGLFRETMGDARFTGWMIWPVTEAVAARALSGGGANGSDGARADATEGGDAGAGAAEGAGDAEGGDARFDRGMALLADLTGRLTSEFAVRGLLQANLARALPIIQSWTRSDDEHVRRLASEGTRAFLPWAIRVPALLAAPESTLPVIGALYRDESEYVRRSVANHLNDLSRQNPDLAARVAGEWMHAPDENTAKVVRHGLRSLVKKGHPATLALFGFEAEHGVRVEGPTLVPDAAGAGSTSVAVGGELPFSVTLTNDSAEPRRLVVDYVVHHRKANGGQTAKVFKLATLTLEPGRSVTYDRQHSFRLITTRRYHPGPHAIEVQVNGAPSGRADFELTV